MELLHSIQEIQRQENMLNNMRGMHSAKSKLYEFYKTNSLLSSTNKLEGEKEKAE